MVREEMEGAKLISWKGWGRQRPGGSLGKLYTWGLREVCRGALHRGLGGVLQRPFWVPCWGMEQ